MVKRRKIHLLDTSTSLTFCGRDATEAIIVVHIKDQEWRLALDHEKCQFCKNS